MSKYLYVENTTEIDCGDVVIRLWAEKSSPPPRVNLVRSLYDVFRNDSPEFVERLRVEVPGLNAVQVHGKNEGVRIGWVAYLVPFKEES